MTTVIQNPIPAYWPVQTKSPEQARRIGAAWAWKRVPLVYPGDVPTPAPQLPSEPEPTAEEQPKHTLGAGPEMVDIRALVPVYDDVSSTGRHHALAPAVLAALSKAGA